MTSDSIISGTGRAVPPTPKTPAKPAAGDFSALISGNPVAAASAHQNDLLALMGEKMADGAGDVMVENLSAANGMRRLSPEMNLYLQNTPPASSVEGLISGRVK